MILLLFFIVSLIQIILSFIVVNNELSKFEQKEESKINEELVADYGAMIFIMMAIILSFFNLPFCYLFIGFVFYFSVFVVINQFKKQHANYLIIDGASLLIGIILYAALNKYLKNGTDFVLFCITPGLISITSICYSFLKKFKQ